VITATSPLRQVLEKVHYKDIKLLLRPTPHENLPLNQTIKPENQKHLKNWVKRLTVKQ
jgi:hypothetical protein